MHEQSISITRSIWHKINSNFMLKNTLSKHMYVTKKSGFILFSWHLDNQCQDGPFLIEDTSFLVLLDA